MSAQCLVISDLDADRRVADEIARINGFGRKNSTDPGEIQSFLLDHPQTVVLWNGDDKLRAESIARLLEKSCAPTRVFLITDRALQTYPWHFKSIAFSHHWLRRFAPPTPTIYARLTQAALTQAPLGLARYFPPGTPAQEILLTRSRQKVEAVDGVENTLSNLNVVSRLAALAAQSCDELIMNAIFDAPMHTGGDHYQRVIPRDADFELKAREHVKVEIMTSDDLVGIGVIDQFGSLKREVLMSFLAKDYAVQDYTVRRNDHGAGLGLSGTIQAGLSLIFVCRPGIMTEVMILFPRTSNFRAFREGFRFLSIFA